MLSQFIKLKKSLRHLIILALGLVLLTACATPPKKTSDGTMSAAERLARIKKTGTSKEPKEDTKDEQSQTSDGTEQADESSPEDSETLVKEQEKNTTREEKKDELYDFSTSVYTLPKAKKRVHVQPEVSKETRDAYKDALKSMEKGLKTKDFEEALEQFKALDAQNNQFSGPSTNIGMIYLHQEKYAEAEAAFKKALAINNENERAHNNLGLVYRELGKFPEAKASYQSAIELDPKYAEAHYNLGILAELYLQDIELAIQSFEHYKLAHRKKDEQVDTWLVDLRNRLQIEKQLAAKAAAQANPETQAPAAASESNLKAESETPETTQPESESADDVTPTAESQTDQNAKTDSGDEPSPVESDATSNIEESE